MSLTLKQARLLAQKCKWIHRMQFGQGIFRNAFDTGDIYWSNPTTYNTEFPSRPGDSHIYSCLNAWTSKLKLLDIDPDGQVWPYLTGELQTKVKKKCKNATQMEACSRILPGTNFLERISIGSAANYYLSNAVTLRNTAAHKLRRDTFKSLLPLPNTAKHSPAWAVKQAALSSKYAAKRLKDMTKQREVYWLWVDQILLPLTLALKKL
jgi:hypothetical protein